jgi:hypothetical protein
LITTPASASTFRVYPASLSIPAGYNCFINSIACYNPSGSSQNVSFFASPDGGTTLYPLTGALSCGAGNTTSVGPVVYSLLPGDSLWCTNSAAAGVTLSGSVMFYPTSSPIIPITHRWSSSTTPSGTVIYTCPVGVKALFVGGNTNSDLFPSFLAQTRFCCTTGTPQVKLLINNTYVTNSAPASPGTVLNLVQMCAGVLNAGDTLNLTCSTSSTLAHVWLSVAQYPSSIFTAPPAPA